MSRRKRPDCGRSESRAAGGDDPACGPRSVISNRWRAWAGTTLPATLFGADYSHLPGAASLDAGVAELKRRIRVGECNYDRRAYGAVSPELLETRRDLGARLHGPYMLRVPA